MSLFAVNYLPSATTQTNKSFHSNIWGIKCLTRLQRVGLAEFRVALIVRRHHRHGVVLPTLDVCHPALLAVRPAADRLAVSLRHRGRVELGPRRAAPRHHGDVGQAVHETADVGGRARLCEKTIGLTLTLTLWGRNSLLKTVWGL